MTGREWIDAFAREIGVDAPTDEVVDQLLDLAGVAAHASERVAAPIACYLAAQAGLDAASALARARAIAP